MKVHETFLFDEPWCPWCCDKKHIIIIIIMVLLSLNVKIWTSASGCGFELESLF